MTEIDSPAAIDETLPDALSADRLFRLLAHPYRRSVLEALARRDEPTSIERLAAEVAATESDRAETAVDADQRTVRNALYHVHLPKLAEADLIALDPATNSVAPPADEPRPATLIPLLSSQWA